MPFKVTDNVTKKTITFQDKPTEQDMQEAFGMVSGGSPSSPPSPPSQTAEELEEEEFVKNWGANAYGAKKAGEAIGRVGTAGASGFNTGLAGITGMPVDFINTLLTPA